jgi:septum formation protein
MEQIGLVVEVFPSHVSEEFDPAVSPAENASRLATLKAKSVAEKFADAIIIGADTIVVIDGAVLGKPENAADACRMLRILSGRTHTVYTAFSLVDRPSNRSVTEVEATRVTFRVLPINEIENYVNGGSPLDKAGAYGIQDDYGAVFATRIEGCFYNVVGLPVSKFYTTLQKFQSEIKMS